MRTTMWLVRSFFFAALLAGATAGGASAAEHRFGLGYLYWQALEGIESARIEEDGAAPFLTYKYVPEGRFRLELDLEYYADGFGGSDSAAYLPSVYALVEFGLYAGVGVGGTVTSDGIAGLVFEPFYVVRLGWDFQVVPRLQVDLHASYRVGISLLHSDERYDVVTLGAAARVAF